MNKLAHNRTAERRKAYFATKGIADVPYEQNSRYLKAKQLLEQIPADYESAAMLYDKIDDFDHAGFLILMGSIHAIENSPHYNLEEARKFFKKSYIYSEDVSQKIQASQSILSSYSKLKGTDIYVHPFSHGDPFILESILFLRGQNIEPGTQPQEKNVKKGQFYEAGIYGAGNGVKKDSTKSVLLYQDYIETGEEGYFSASYKNLAIRYALGLGCNQSLEYAYNLVRTGRIILEEMPYRPNDPILNILSKMHTEARTHNYIYDNIAFRYNKTESAWSFLDVIHDVQPQHRNAVVSVLSLYAVLAKREKWNDIDDWEKLYNYALSHLSMESKDNIRILSEDEELASEKFHPQIIQQEKSRLHLRDQRIRMYEYFRDHDLGIPPVDQKDRYQLALKFRNQQRINYDAVYALFDPEEDTGHADWLHLIGCVHDEARQYYDPRKAFSYYKQASGLGHGAASYKVGKKYEEGNVILIDLDDALRFYKLSKMQGFNQAQPSIERLTEFLGELYLMSNDQTIRRKIFDLYKYFQDNNLGVVPVSQDARHSYAMALTDKIPPDYDFAEKLFIPEIDNAHSNWLLLMGFIYDDHKNNPNYDAEESISFFKRSSALGNSAASSNIALKYEQGKETSIDLDEALKWFELASNQGSISAMNSIARIHIFKKSLESPSLDFKPTEDIVALYVDGANKGDIGSYFQYAKCLMNGTGVGRNKNAAIESYNDILLRTPQYHEQSLHTSVAHITAVRYFLGLDCEPDHQKSLNALALIPKTSNHTDIKYIRIPEKEKLIKIIKRCNNSGVRNRYESVLNDLVPIYHEGKNPFSIASKIESNAIKIDHEFVEVLNMIYGLSSVEDWPNKRQWNDLMECALAKGICLTHEQVTFSTLISGPRYTPLDHNGLPVLGVWEPPSANGTESHRVTKEAFVPSPGVVALKGIIAHPEQGISFDVVESKELPAMLLPQDFDVALILSFGHPDRVLWPSLSLEDVEDDIVEVNRTLLQRKVFFPEWLGYSDFGKTLFTTDQLIGNWAWRAETHSIGNRNNTFRPEAHEMAKGFIKEIRLTGGRSGSGSSSRVMLCPEKFQSHIYTKTQGQSTTLHVDVAEMKMRVDGSYILEEIKENGEVVENRLVSLNDTTFEQGRVCQKLTDYFDVVAKLDPRFERARQLMALFYSLADLREKTNYKPPSNFQRQLTEKLVKYEKDLGRLPKHELICRRIPFMR